MTTDPQDNTNNVNCVACGYVLQLPPSVARPEACPKCRSRRGWALPSTTSPAEQIAKDALDSLRDRQTTTMRLDEKTALLIHIKGIPFMLEGPATIASHPANFELAGLPAPSEVGP